jgi:hypothetical protein
MQSGDGQPRNRTFISRCDDGAMWHTASTREEEMADGWPRTLTVPFTDHHPLAIVVWCPERAALGDGSPTPAVTVELTQGQGEALLRHALAVPEVAAHLEMLAVRDADVIAHTARGGQRAVRCTGGHIYRW